MNDASPFLDLDPGGPRVSVRFDGTDHALPEGANLAAALLAAGVRVFRATPVSGAPRAPFCMMGACYDCLVLIDGVTRQACMTRVTDGLVVERAPGRDLHDG
ncbi:(2Fe-2S)-binding protein [Rhodovulum euryhalinum]|uniref:2Fe-2S iron-sulfur cluster protein n=1 Tax=Rhodovulum euryhalinum TaxID=35805 RepID=A0A4R2KG86_9RHOB|nr:(2Fe-2S)-binding protein [Rhodovulum euryhalinum]TCO72114.1 2Fe-2S iron-sulfur cluster protein [Rhodovulum euryhalinum]